MPRKMIIHLEGGGKPILNENLADSEMQLQELIKEHPELLPVEEFGLDDQFMVVGRETTLPSGAIDLVGLTRSGEILVIEFKTGPQNSDFRHALAQLLDYGSDLWGMTYDEFEGTVARRYFASDRCSDPKVKAKSSLVGAIKAAWPDILDDEVNSFKEQLSGQLASGAFTYVLIAQKFRPSVIRTAEYLNRTNGTFRFCAVELVKFGSEGISAFETRTVVKPTAGPNTTSSRTTRDEALGGVDNPEYRDAIDYLMDVCSGLGLTLHWGTVGASIRSMMPSGSATTIGWWFPPGRSGWMGLTDLTLGMGTWFIDANPEFQPNLQSYLNELKAIDGTYHEVKGGVDAYSFDATAVVVSKNRIAEILATFVKSITVD